MYAFLAAIIICWALPGLAVSRVGGGKIRSNSSGFEMTVPAPFFEIGVYSGGLIATGPPAFSPVRGMMRQFIEISEFSDEFKDATQLDRKNLIDRFSNSQWRNVGDQNSCVLTLQNQKDSLIAYIVTWGDGKGVVLKGPRSLETEKAMHDILQSLYLDDGACAWK